jgi:hypothetical protein
MSIQPSQGQGFGSATILPSKCSILCIATPKYTLLLPTHCTRCGGELGGVNLTKVNAGTEVPAYPILVFFGSL